MDKYVFDNNNGLWYEQNGDYYIPCLTLPTEEEQPIGKGKSLLIFFQKGIDIYIVVRYNIYRGSMYRIEIVRRIYG